MGLLDGTTQQTYYQGDDHGGYQFTSLTDIINQFMMVYVGEDKIIPKAKRLDVAFHAQRALAELSFDTLKSVKAQEITLPPSLQMTLPHDYVNYTKVSWVDSAGIKHLLYPASKTSNPTNPLQNDDGIFELGAIATFVTGLDYLVLDSEYTNIFPGMKVQSGHVPVGSDVISTVKTDGTYTSIQLGNQHLSSAGYIAFSSLLTGTIPIKIINNDGSLQGPIHKKSYRANNVTITAASAIMTVSASDIANIEVGMFIHMMGPFFGNATNIPNTTTVLAISGNDITMSNVSVFSSSSSDNDVNFVSPDLEDSTTWSNYKSGTPSENQNDYQDDMYWPMDGTRYGLDPQHAQANGSFYIDDNTGKIHFSSNVSGKTVILDYISDSLGTDGEMQVHKFAEEAMYKWISHAILAGRANTPEYQVNRFKKERFAAIRTAKLRLSNLKLEELTQILRGKSKQIKH
jgi:hypothetical protein